MRILIVFYQMKSRTSLNLSSSQNQLVDNYGAQGHDILQHVHPESTFVPMLDVARITGPAPSMLLPDMLGNILVKAQAEQCEQIIFDLRACYDPQLEPAFYPHEMWHMFNLAKFQPSGWVRNPKQFKNRLAPIVGLMDIPNPATAKGSERMQDEWPQAFTQISRPQVAYA